MMCNRKISSFLLALVFSISQVPTVGNAADRDNRPPALNPALMNPDGLPPELRHFTDEADKIGAGRGNELPFSDPYRIVGQRVEVYEGADTPIYSYDPSQPRSTSFNLVYTKIKAIVDFKNQQLILEASRGENENGENGVKVARQIIPNYEIAAIAQDAELLSIVSANGQLDAIDWGFVVEHAFESPIPVVTKLWEPPKPFDFSQSRVSATYLTRGVTPVDLKPSENSVIPLDSRGQPRLIAGDLLVTTEDNGRQAVVGIFSRAVTHQLVSRGARMFQALVAIATNDFEEIASLEPMIQQAEEEYDEFENELNNLDNSMTPAAIDALASFDHEQLATLESRVKAHAALVHRVRDWFTVEEWHKSFSDLVDLAKKQKVSQNRLASNWQDVIKKSRATTKPTDEGDSTAQSAGKSASWVQRTGKSFFAGIKANKIKILAVSLTALAWNFPAAYERSETLQQIHTLTWLYDHLYGSLFPVLKDAAYRYNPLALSTLALVGIWPVALAFAVGANRTINYFSRSLQGSNSRFARSMRDLAKNWGKMTRWQTLTSFGSRIYSRIFYPIWKAIAEIVFRQKAFFTAYEKNLNPFKVIDPDSVAGREAGLTEPERLGIVKPAYFGKESLAKWRASTARKTLLQSIIEQDKKRSINLAWMLATLVVAEKSGVDLATLLQAESKTDRFSILRLLASDQKNVEDWTLLAHEINRAVLDLQAERKIDFSKLDLQQLSDFYQLAKDTAEQVKNLDYRTEVLKKKLIAFKKISLQLKNEVINFGVSDFRFLNSIYSNQFVSNAVQQDFVSDHLMVVLIMAVYGQRADPLHPAKLAAMKDGFLWTSRPHLTDIGFNTYIHFFVQGARQSLMYQKLSAKTEGIYNPWEAVAFNPQPKQQAFFPALGSFLKDLNPWENDVGGNMVDVLKREFRMVQAFFFANVPLRIFAGGQTIHNAIAGTEFVWVTKMWYYYWVWPILMQGKARYVKRFEKLNENYLDAQRLISWGIRETDPVLAKSYLETGVAKMREFYDSADRETAKLILDFDGNILPPSQLLEVSMSRPPIALNPSNTIQGLASVFGAVSTTILAIPMSVKSFDSEYLTVENLAFDNTISLAAYVPAYFLLSDRWKQIPALVSQAIKNIHLGIQQCSALLKNERPSANSGE